ncbi:MAG: CDC27 family protein, partial [Myxococcales bacterium]|nr:CDC27 family protein [Myxococcales bacterium]
MLSRAKALALGAPALAALTLALTFAGAGCALEAKQCLETPASPRISSRAVATCEKALGLDLARRDVFHRTVQVLRVRGRYEDIENWARKVLAEHPRRTDAIYALAYALRHQGQYQEALVKYKAYAKANKEDAGAYFGIALCHEALGDRSGAIGAYRKYVARERRDSQRAWRQRAEQRIGALGGGAALASAVSP